MKSSRSISCNLFVIVFIIFSLLSFYSVARQDPNNDKPNRLVQVPRALVTNVCDSCYYLDSVDGADSNPGTSIDKPWKSLAQLRLINLTPGSVVHFKRGSHWSGGLEILDSGVEGKPILFTTYGIGYRPIFTNPGDGTKWTSAITIFAKWVIVEGLLTSDAHDAGVYIAKGSDYNIVRDIESTNVGIGISVLGQHNLITNNYLHDLRMTINTPGGDDDYGAVGVWIANSDNEISYNKIVNCIAPSYDFGTDGGAVEWYGFADRNYVHHNWATGNKGFLEVGGGSAKDTLVAYNISVNNGRFSIIHLSDKFQSDVNNFRVQNNTIVEDTNSEMGWVVLGFGGDPNPFTFLLQNNIFYIEKFQALTNKSNFTHDHNLYYTNNVTELGFALGKSEINSDPLFTDRPNENFRLKPGSPAISQGVYLGSKLDFNNHLILSSSAPDLGAYEFP